MKNDDQMRKKEEEKRTLIKIQTGNDKEEQSRKKTALIEKKIISIITQGKTTQLKRYMKEFSHLRQQMRGTNKVFFGIFGCAVIIRQSCEGVFVKTEKSCS